MFGGNKIWIFGFQLDPSVANYDPWLIGIQISKYLHDNCTVTIMIQN